MRDDRPDQLGGAGDPMAGERVVMLLASTTAVLGVAVVPDVMLWLGVLATILALVSLRNWSGMLYLDPRTSRGRWSVRWRLYLFFVGVVALTASQRVPAPTPMLLLAISVFVLEPLLTARVWRRIAVRPAQSSGQSLAKHGKEPVPRNSVTLLILALVSPSALVFVFFIATRTTA